MRIIAFGEVMLRLTCEPYKRLIQNPRLDMLFTGTGVNVLAGLHLMGHECYLLSALPNHAVGEAASASLRHLGIHDDYMIYEGNHIGCYFLEMGIGERTSRITYLNRQASSFNQAHYNLTKFAIDIAGFDAIHFCGISLAQSQKMAKTVMEMAKIAKEAGVMIVFDCNYRPSQWQDREETEIKSLYQKMLSLSDIAFLSVKDAAHLDVATEGVAEINILKDIRKKYDLKALFGTRRIDQGYQGYFCTEQQYVESKLYPLTVYDRIGAGDAFASSALHGYFSGWTAEHMIDFAGAAGALAHTTYGDSPVLSLAEIEAYCRYGAGDIKR